MADFNFYINRQGIQGRKGEKGDKGFSPTINVSTDTVDEYKLIIANEDNTFETPNLRGNINVLDNGGTYLRYDKETQQISAQDMDAATASTLGGVRLSTEENIAAMSADTVVTPADVADALPVYLQGEGAVSITQDAETSKTKINVDLSSVNELSTRVSNAEAEIVGIQADIANIDADVSTLNSVTANHTASISAINNNIADLNNNKVAKTDFATTETAGIVKVDGTTIAVGENGVISSVGGGGTGDSYTKSETDALLSEKNDNIFDISKFTIEGSLTITDNGIASGFSVRDYIYKNNSFPLDGKVVIRVKFNTNGSGGLMRIYNQSNASVIACYTKPYLECWGACQGNWGMDTLQYNKPYVMELTLDKTNSKAKINIYDESGTQVVTSNDQSYDFSSTTLFKISELGKIGANFYDGSIDLKPFSITINDKEVFNSLMSSTKPIYDAVKANNTELSEFKTETSSNFSAVNSALNEKANLSDLSLKQNKLVSGTNIKTINGQSVLGEGDITVGGSTPTNMVTTDTAQTITGQKSFTNHTKFGASGYAGNIDVGDLSDAYFHIYGSRSGANRYLGIGANGSAASLDGSWFTQSELYYSKGTTGTIFGDIPSGSIRYLHEGLIEAGNGIVIESSTKLNGAGAIKISSTGATIDDVTSSKTSTYSSNKIDSLIGNISTVLDSINGEVI